MLLLASEYGFKRVVGVDFSKELCEYASKNIAIYKEKAGVDIDIEAIFSDAALYEIKNDENVFFLYNPFDSVVLKNFLDNINASLEKDPRKIYLIYHCPEYNSIIEREKYLISSEKYMLYGCEFTLYILMP
jgi:hypothetical protein